MPNPASARTQRFHAYVERLTTALGHRDRHGPLRAYVTGLCLLGDRKSIEPMAARVDPRHVRARHQYRADTHRFGVLPKVATDLENWEVVLVIDDGPYFFELRGISVRGLARRIDRAEPCGADALAWYVIEPRRILAWNYDTIREA
jgi:DDE superfamily endonuclease